MKTFNLQSLLDMAESHAKTAARNLGRTYTQEQAEDQKLQMLIDYRIDYQNKFLAASNVGLDSASWGNYEEFMIKLDLAVKQQSEVVAQWRRQSQAMRRELETKQQRLISYDTLSARHYTAESRREGKREQREHDEYAAAVHARLVTGE